MMNMKSSLTNMVSTTPNSITYVHFRVNVGIEGIRDSTPLVSRFNSLGLPLCLRPSHCVARGLWPYHIIHRINLMATRLKLSGNLHTHGQNLTSKTTTCSHIVDPDFEPDFHFDRSIQRYETQLNQMNLET